MSLFYCKFLFRLLCFLHLFIYLFFITERLKLTFWGLMLVSANASLHLEMFIVKSSLICKLILNSMYVWVLPQVTGYPSVIWPLPFVMFFVFCSSHINFFLFTIPLRVLPSGCSGQYLSSFMPAVRLFRHNFLSFCLNRILLCYSTLIVVSQKSSIPLCWNADWTSEREKKKINVGAFQTKSFDKVCR